MVSSREADWSREMPRKFWDPSRKLLKAIRKYQLYKQKGGFVSSFISKIYVLKHLFWSTISGANVPINSKLGGGLIIPHANGIVIHQAVELGVNCLVHQQVTIGVKRGSPVAPVIKGHVDIGAGAKVIGPIVIGEHALIGANAVVVCDVEPYAIVAGVPAKVIGSTKTEYE